MSPPPESISKPSATPLRSTVSTLPLILSLRCVTGRHGRAELCR